MELISEVVLAGSSNALRAGANDKSGGLARLARGKAYAKRHSLIALRNLIEGPEKAGFSRQAGDRDWKGRSL